MLNHPNVHFEPIPASRYPVAAGVTIQCGYLTVPEVRSLASGQFPNERTLRLYVTVIKSLHTNPKPDPVLVLNGGPGATSGGWLRQETWPIMQQAFLTERDVILLDQRGTGFSEPHIFAPGRSSSRPS